eukprot:3026009-Rhodomonas_salina.2
MEGGMGREACLSKTVALTMKGPSSKLTLFSATCSVTPMSRLLPAEDDDDQSMPRAPERSMSWRWNAKSTVAVAGTPPVRVSVLA